MVNFCSYRNPNFTPLIIKILIDALPWNCFWMQWFIVDSIIKLIILYCPNCHNRSSNLLFLKIYRTKTFTLFSCKLEKKLLT